MWVETRFEVGRVVADFWVEGRPAPHCFDKGPDKTRLMTAWQSKVRKAAESAMMGLEPYSGDVAVRITFFAKTPKGKRHRDRWSQEVVWVPARNGAKKIDSDQPDTDNLFKATQDALRGYVLADDVSVCKIESERLYDDHREGAHIAVWAY